MAGDGAYDGSTERPEGFRESAKQLAVRTFKDAQQDRTPGLAAEVAFFTILSLPPLILALFGVAGFATDLIGDVNTAKVRDWVLDAADGFLSENAIETTIRPTVDAVLDQGRADVALLGLALALWSGSRATNIAMRAITLAYDLDPRPGWQRRVLAIAITVAGILLGLVVIPLMVVGPRLAEIAGLPSPLPGLWTVLYWPTMGLLVAGLLATLYHVSVPWWTPWRRDFPGAVLGVAMWLAGSAALRVYTSWTIGSDSTYGPLATPIVILLWLYVTSLAVLLGAEVNAEIEKLWPHHSTRHDRNAEDETPGKSTREIEEDEETVQA